MCSLLLELPEEKEPWREVESVSLYKLGAVTSYEKTGIGDPKVSFFDSQIKSSVAAKVRIQGAHPWIVRSTFLTSILQVQKKVGDLRLQVQNPSFQLHRGKKKKKPEGLTSLCLSRAPWKLKVVRKLQ